MIDTGSTKSVIREELVPTQFRQKLVKPVKVSQFDTRTIYLTHCLNNIPIRIERQQFTLPLTFISPVGSYKFILGLNFIKSLQGFLYTPPDITFFKKGITTTDQSNLIEAYNSISIEESSHKEEILDEQNSIDYDDTIFELEYPTIGELPTLEIIQLERPKSLEELLQLAEQTRIIGEDPQLHWNKNKILAKLDIINPDLTIKTADMASNLVDKQEFEQQIKELLNLKVIRPSKSRHRSAAFIVRKHSEVKRGKARIVYNYRRLNDNTYEDSYKLPNKDELINKIQESKYFSKFDCKSGFWQIKLAEESIDWTAFTCPEGHFEWLVMPFGLKNAPSIFQRKMDQIFKKYDSFCSVYVDDILIHSKNKNEHRKHLEIILQEFINNGIIISKNKIDLEKQDIEFLGIYIKSGTIQLQEHIAKKVLEFPDKLEDKKQLQAFLGLLNYARSFIPDLGRKIAVLHSKTSKTGQKYFNTEDIKLVQQIKQEITKLTPLVLPLDNNYKIVETDASALGWAGILYQKKYKESSKSDEQICRYSSGKFNDIQSKLPATDLEILGIINSLEAFSLFLHNEIFTIRTDCQNVVSHYNKITTNKQAARRWVNFVDSITGNGFKPQFEHIKGADNTLADILSRLIH